MFANFFLRYGRFGPHILLGPLLLDATEVKRFIPDAMLHWLCTKVDIVENLSRRCLRPGVQYREQERFVRERRKDAPRIARFCGSEKFGVVVLLCASAFQ